MNSARERIHVVSASVSRSGGCGVRETGPDNAGLCSLHFVVKAIRVTSLISFHENYSPVLYMHLTVCLFVIFIAFLVVEYLIVQSQYLCNCSNFVEMRNKALML